MINILLKQWKAVEYSVIFQIGFIVRIINASKINLYARKRIFHFMMVKLQDHVLVMSSNAEISGISFQLYGGINAEGNIFLRKVTSYDAGLIVIPNNMESVDVGSLMSVVMENFNNKLLKNI